MQTCTFVRLNNFFDMGLGFFLVLNEDGSGYLDMMKEKTPLTWDKSNITAGDGEDKDEQPYSYDNGTISMETEGTSMTFVRMTDTETEDYKNGKFGKSPEEIGEELAQGVLSGDEESIEKAKSMLGEENLADYTEDASAQTEDGYTLPDMSDESHEDAGYYSIYAYTENGTRYTAEELAAAGVTFDLMLCPDGSGYANFLDENYDLSWKDGYLNILKEDGVEIMDYGSGNYMGTKTISLTEEDDETDVTMSFEYASEADSTYEWKYAAASASKGKGTSKEEANTAKTNTSKDTGAEKESVASALAKDVTYSFQGYRTTVQGDFVQQFFGSDSPESVFKEMNGSMIYFWLVDPESGKAVADGNASIINHINKDLSVQAEDDASRIPDVEYIGEETIGSYKVYSEKKSQEKDSAVWRSIYFEADGNRYMISGTFKDLDTLGKFVDLYVKNVKVEKE